MRIIEIGVSVFNCLSNKASARTLMDLLNPEIKHRDHTVLSVANRQSKSKNNSNIDLDYLYERMAKEIQRVTLIEDVPRWSSLHDHTIRLVLVVMGKANHQASKLI